MIMCYWLPNQGAELHLRDFLKVALSLWVAFAVTLELIVLSSFLSLNDSAPSVQHSPILSLWAFSLSLSSILLCFRRIHINFDSPIHLKGGNSLLEKEGC